MGIIERLISVADAFIQVTGEKPSTVSLHAFGHTTKLGALRTGSGITVYYAEQAFEWFDINWPDGEEQPEALTTWRALIRSPSSTYRAKRNP